MDAIVGIPELEVEIDGRPLGDGLRRTLGEIVVSQQLSCPTQCELVFVDLGIGEALDALMPGAPVEIRFTRQHARLFSGEITALNDRYDPNQGRELRMRCYDRLHRLRKRQPVRTHSDQRLSDLAAAIVSDLGIGVEAEGDGPVLRWLVQHDESDLELLRARAERVGCYFYLQDDELHLMSLRGNDSWSCELVRGESLLEATVDMNTDRACRVVETHAWDPWRAASCPGSASDARSGREISAAAGPQAVGGEELRTLTGITVQDTAQADALAQGELDRRHANEVVLSGVADGNPMLRPGTVVQVRGLAEAFEGRYMVSRAVHRIDRRGGYLTEIDTAVPEPATPAPRDAMTYGVVTDVDDPQGLGRVRVTLPAYADTPSLWMQVLLPAAGPGKGLIALPDVDDRVLVMFGDNDPAQGVVLGGLYGEEAPPDEAGVEGGAIERYLFLTPGGQRLTLDDGRRRVRVENEGGEFLELAPDRVRAGNSAGSFIELASRGVRLHAEADLEIEAPGRAITIRGSSIDFESA